MKTRNLVLLVGLLAAPAGAQSVLFDFDNAPLRSGLPIDLTVGGITAHFSSTGPGSYSIQPADTMGFTPAGFAGYCLYPIGIDAADLHVGFSTPLSAFSILYSPHELACDTSATLRVTAYMDGTLVGTGTTNATALCVCTWPGQTLAFNSGQVFNSVVVHYESPGATCENYGTIFMADNMLVTPAPLPMLLTGPTRLPTGAFQFNFTNWPNLPFTAFGTTNLTLPFSNWTSLGAVTEGPPGQYQFTDLEASNLPRRFYRATSP
jgi:hypothetical protein